MTTLEKSIIATITYFDVFEYPLTIIEVWKWLYQGNNSKESKIKYTLFDIQTELDKSESLKSVIGRKYGFYFLKGKERHIITRQQRYQLAERKFKRAIKFARFIKFVPFVRMIAVCNSLGYSNARNTSDIDFFIITSRGRIWTTRFLTVWIMKLLRLRPRRGHKQDTLCFSFFLSEDHLNLSDIQLRSDTRYEKTIDDDIYFTYWLSQITPIYDQVGVYEKFWKKNMWITTELPNIFKRTESHRRWVLHGRVTRAVISFSESRFANKFVNKIEIYAKKLQLAIMPETLINMSKDTDTRVVINNDMLKMHYNDRRGLYWSMWQDKMDRVIGKEVG